MTRIIQTTLAIAAIVAAANWGLWARTAEGAGPGVHGRVLGHDEQGAYLGVVPGAKIQFETASGAAAGNTVSDANGYYKLDLPPGEYLYKIDAAGYRKEDRGRGMRLAQSQGYAVFNLALTKGEDDPNRKPPERPTKKIGRLHGRVVEEQKTSRVGIPEARIMLRRDGSNRVVTVYSRGGVEGDRQVGDYEVSLEAGVYRASVMAAGFATFVDPTPLEIKSDADTERDFVLRRREPPPPTDQGIRGVVTVVDSRTTPPSIKLQIVPLTGEPAAPIDVSLAANGSYTQRLPSSRYRVTASAEGFPSATSPPAFVFDGRYTIVNLALRPEHVPEPKTTVDVFVYERQKEGAPLAGLAGARVSLVKKGADAATAQEATSTSTGHAIFPVTEAGDYTAQAFLKGYRPGQGQGSVQLGRTHEVGIELVKDETPSPTETLTLEVSAIDAISKRPLAGVRVLARLPEQSLAEAARGVTNSSGAATLALPRGAGEYTVLGQLSGYEPAGVKVSLAARQPSRALLALRPIALPPDEPRPPLPPDDRPLPEPDRTPIILRGFVAYREASGTLRSVPDAKVIWERVVPTRPAVTQFTASSRSGRFQLELPQGVYQVRIDPPAGFDDLLERVVVEPGLGEKYFILRRAERPEPKPGDKLVAVQGMVVSAAPGGFAPVRDAELLFVRTNSSERTQAGSTGEFRLQLAPDQYRVHVRAKGFEPLDTQAIIRTDMSPLRFVLERHDDPAASVRLNVQVIERGRYTTAGIRAVADAQVQVLLDGRVVQSGETNRSGQYTAQVRSGVYSVRVAKRGFQPTALAVEVGKRDVTEQITLVREQAEPEPEPSHKGTLLVRVTQPMTRPSNTITATGVPLPGAQVTILRGSMRVAGGTTDGAGTFSSTLTPGRYSVKVEHQGFAPAGRTATLAGRDTHLEVQLERLHSDHSPPSVIPDRRLKPPGLDLGGGRLTPPGGKAEVFVAEYRTNPKLPWMPVVKRSSRAEAQRALVQAIARGTIPKSAETRIREE